MGIVQLGLALLGVAAVVGGRELVRRRVLRRRGQALALVAGTFVSYLGAVAIVFLWGTCIGAPGAARTVVDEVLAGFDATTKLQPGDVIVAADGEPVIGVGRGLADRVDAAAPGPIVLGIERGGAHLDVSVLPRAEGGRWLLGIMKRFDYERDRRAGAALVRALRYPVPDFAELRVFGADAPEPAGPKMIVEEVRRYPSFAEGVLAAMMRFAAYALYAMLVADLARAVLARRKR